MDLFGSATAHTFDAQCQMPISVMVQLKLHTPQNEDHGKLKLNLVPIFDASVLSVLCLGKEHLAVGFLRDMCDRPSVACGGLGSIMCYR